MNNWGTLILVSRPRLPSRPQTTTKLYPILNYRYGYRGICVCVNKNFPGVVEWQSHCQTCQRHSLSIASLTLCPLHHSFAVHRHLIVVIVGIIIAIIIIIITIIKAVVTSTILLPYDSRTRN